MKPGGVLHYRCRKCGVVEANPHVPNVLLALTCITGGRSLPEGWGSTGYGLTEVHHCDERGGWGVADLIGGRQDVEEGG
jgi:hypothetical protein